MLFRSCPARLAQKIALQQIVLGGYDAMMASDYVQLADLLTEDGALHAVDGAVVTKAKLQRLAEMIE